MKIKNPNSKKENIFDGLNGIIGSFIRAEPSQTIKSKVTAPVETTKRTQVTEQQDDFSQTLHQFTTSLKQRIKEIEDVDSKEVCFLSDESLGLRCELHSRKFDVSQLSGLGIQILDDLRAKRKEKKSSAIK